MDISLRFLSRLGPELEPVEEIDISVSNTVPQQAQEMGEIRGKLSVMGP